MGPELWLLCCVRLADFDGPNVYIPQVFDASAEHFQAMLLLPLTETSKEVVKDVVLEVAVELYDILEGTVPAEVIKLEFVEVTAPEKVA